MDNTQNTYHYYSIIIMCKTCFHRILTENIADIREWKTYDCKKCYDIKKEFEKFTVYCEYLKNVKTEKDFEREYQRVTEHIYSLLEFCEEHRCDENQYLRNSNDLKRIYNVIKRLECSDLI